MFSTIIDFFIDALFQLSEVVPVTWFTFIGAFIEELIAPIPSPIVMTLGGSLAASQGSGWDWLLILALIGAVGKTIGSYLVYWLSDKGEDLVLTKFGKFLGVSHKEVEVIGKYLNHGWHDDILLFLFRAIPIMPTAPVSIVCGLIKLNLRTYIVSTFFGTLVRNVFYLYLGYTSLDTLESLNEGIDSLEKFGYIILLGLIGALMVFIYYQRRTDAGLKFLSKKLDQKPGSKKK